jgi:hypothetical protein
MYRSRFVLLILFAMLLTSCAGKAQSQQIAAELVPVACHSEWGVGMLFITIENRGQDAGPSTMTVVYNTNSPQMPRVQLMVATPGIPSLTPIWLAVDLPPVSGTGNFLLPVGKITITVDAKRVLSQTDRASNVLITSCADRT